MTSDSANSRGWQAMHGIQIQSVSASQGSRCRGLFVVRGSLRSFGRFYMHKIRKAKRQQQGVDAAHMVGPTLTQESLTESEQYVRRRNLEIWDLTKHGEKMKIFARYLCHSTFVWASPGVKVWVSTGSACAPFMWGQWFFIVNDRPQDSHFGLG